MSVIFNATGEAAKRLTNCVAATSNYTCTFYVKFTDAPVPATYQTAFLTVTDIASYQAFAWIGREGTSNLVLIVNNGVGSGNLTAGSFATVEDVWYRVAYVRVGTSHRFYVNGTLIGTAVASFSTGAVLGEIWIGDDQTGLEGTDIAYLREWPTALTLAAIQEEWLSPTVVDTGGLWSDIPLLADLNDDSGNGYNLTAVGSLSFDGAAPAFPSNSTRATATDIPSLPDSITQDVWSEGLAYQVWYKHTAAADAVIGIWGYGDGLTPYKARTEAYKDALTTQFLSTNSSGPNRPVRFSLVSGATYYITFIPTTDAPASADLIIEAELFVQQLAPVGSIFVNDDANSLYFPAGLYPSTDGDNYNTLFYINGIVEGEGGDVLLNGKFLLSSVDEGLLRLYGPDAVAITDVAIDIEGRRSLRTCHGTQTFFVGSAGNPVIINEVDDTGAIVDTWSMTGTSTIAALCANNDKTILYNSGTSAQAIRRWDLVNDVALSNFLPSFRQATDILVLADDTILIGYQNLTSSTNDFLVRRYNAAATLLNTYNFGVNESFGSLSRLPCRMAYAIDNPDSFWVYLHKITPDNGVTVFQNIRISDGVVLATIESEEFNQGQYMTAETLTPLSRFGNSISCPFFITRQAFVPETGTGTLIVVKQTIPSGSLQAFDVEVGGGLSPSSLSMVDEDTETYEDVPVGDGYSVEETVPDGWVVSYNVSNDSPIDNIAVSADETVTVIITNFFNPGGGIFTVPTIPTILTTSFPPVGTKTNDDFVNQVDGEPVVTQVKIPNPFAETAFIVDKE